MILGGAGCVGSRRRGGRPMARAFPGAGNAVESWRIGGADPAGSGAQAETIRFFLHPQG